MYDYYFKMYKNGLLYRNITWLDVSNNNCCRVCINCNTVLANPVLVSCTEMVMLDICKKNCYDLRGV